MDDQVPQGTERCIEGQLRVYYDGYWIKAYAVPGDTLLAKKRLIEALTRRLFNHVEHGLNVPGTRLEEARHAFESETNEQRRRVKAAMLAGALFNRATDVFTKLVELQALGVVIQPDNALMRECGQHLQEALALGKVVLHPSGEEGIDELWGEPFKAFAFPIEEFYKSRYSKIAMTMRAIDRINTEMKLTLAAHASFAGVAERLDRFSAAAKLEVRDAAYRRGRLRSLDVLRGQRRVAARLPAPAPREFFAGPSSLGRRGVRPRSPRLRARDVDGSGARPDAQEHR